MAFSIVGSGGTSGNITTGTTAALPALQAGDIVVVDWVNGAANADCTVSDNSGTGAYSLEAFTNIGVGRSGRHWKRASGAAGASTLTVGNATNSCAFSWQVIRGASTDADPWDVASSAVPVTTARSGIAAGITPTTNGCLIIASVGSRDNIDTSAMALVNGPVLTSQAVGTSAGGNDTQDEMWNGEQATAGDTGNFSFTNAAGATINHGIIVGALKPLASTPHTHSQPDSIAGTDASARTVGKTQADAIAGTDANTRVATFVRAQNDSIAGTDAVAKGVTSAIADTVAATDSITVSPGRAVTIDDSIAATDALTKDAGVGQADALAGTDAVAKASTIGLADALAGADATSRAWTALLAVTDNGNWTDSAQPESSGGSTNWTQTVNDSITASDATASVSSFVRGVGDSASATDAAALGWAALREVADALAATDAITLPAASRWPPATDDHWPVTTGTPWPSDAQSRWPPDTDNHW